VGNNFLAKFSESEKAPRKFCITLLKVAQERIVFDLRKFDPAALKTFSQFSCGEAQDRCIRIEHSDNLAVEFAMLIEIAPHVGRHVADGGIMASRGQVRLNLASGCLGLGDSSGDGIKIKCRLKLSRGTLNLIGAVLNAFQPLIARAAHCSHLVFDFRATSQTGEKGRLTILG